LTAGSDIQAGPSIDQIYAQHCAGDTRLKSIQLCIEDLSALSGVCGHRYGCAYKNTISWASPTAPLPMEMAPRAVFERLFSSGETVDRESRRKTGSSVLDGSAEHLADLQRRLGAGDRNRVKEFLDSVREIEQRIRRAEKEHPAGMSVPDSFEEHVKLMFDLQVLAFRADITRVSTFKMGVDRSLRLYPESGVTTPFHALSHHGETPEKIEEFARLNQYHVSTVAYFLDRLRNTRDGDGSLLDHSMIVYGSPMGDSHVHGHRFLPLFLAGHANGRLRGNVHLRCEPGTPMANVWLTLLHKLGVDVDRIGDSTGEVAI